MPIDNVVKMSFLLMKTTQKTNITAGSILTYRCARGATVIVIKSGISILEYPLRPERSFSEKYPCERNESIR